MAASTEKCPKCPLGYMSGGPIFKQDHTGEYLLYWCSICRYEERRPTMDNKQKEAREHKL